MRPPVNQYELLLEHIFDTGTEKGDRTGTGTISQFGAQLRYDLSKGFPLITTKKVHFKSLAVEMLWFLSGDTNVGFLHQHGVSIWDEWRRPYTLNRELTLVDRIHKNYEPYEGDFSYAGVGAERDSIKAKLAETWGRMMRRCYDPGHHRFPFYGAKGVSVCRRWHNAVDFIEDAQELPHWQYKRTDWSRFALDKDYYGANQYGPDTSVWLSQEENPIYTSAATPIRAVDVGGDEHRFVCAAEAARTLGISTSSMNRFVGAGELSGLKGENKKFVGWLFERESYGDTLLRMKLIEDGELGPVYSKQWRNFGGVDQIANVVETIKSNPNSRRMVVSAWNPPELSAMALEPCHCLFQFYVADGKLSCQLYQRSADMFLGVPFNIASYALLTHMLAQQCDLDVGDLIWTGGDCHIYMNHIDQVCEQVRRVPFAFPRLQINRRPASIFDYRLEDFEIHNYQHHPAIRAQVAV